MPERDMDEAINSDRPFEEVVADLLNAGPVEETHEEDEAE
jgi:hypothetical protein